jgi:hypothetical protein
MRIEIRRFGPLVVTTLVVAAFVVACGPGDDPTGPGRAPGKTAAGGESPAAEGEAAPAKVSPPDPRILADGKAAWRSCAKCHCATDPRIEEDDDWVRLNEHTTCIESGKPAPKVRASILAYLRHPGTLRPILVNQDFKPEEGKETGKVAVPETGGSAYLRANRTSIKQGTPAMVRLHWSESTEEQSMVAPAGEYDVINYWFYRRWGEERKDRWMATGTNVSGCTTMTVTPDSEEFMDLDPVVYGKFTAKRKGEGYALSFSMQDIGGSRMTLSKNGRVVMPGYRILDADGKTVAEGRFGIT